MPPPSSRAMNKVDIVLCWSWLCWFVFLMMPEPCCTKVDLESDTIFQGQELEDWQVLKSASRIFSLEFFRFDESEDRYLCIFSNRDSAVWVANRDNPISDTSGVLTINGTNGMLGIRHSGGYIDLPANSSTDYRNMNMSAILQDDGNLVLRQVYPNGSISPTLLWQSFDYPTNTLLPGMKLGINSKTGYQRLLTSWVSSVSPSSGSYTLGLDRNGTNQLILWWYDQVFWTSEVWQNNTFGDLLLGAFKYISDEDGKYFTSSKAIQLTAHGKIIVKQGGAELVNCDSSSKIPRHGCAKKLPECLNGDSSFYVSDGIYVSLDQYSSTRDNNNKLRIMDCKAKCVKNCSCYGYASLTANGTGCEFWDKENVRLVTVTGRDERIIYTRGIGAANATREKRQKQWWIWLITSVGGALLVVISILCIQRNFREKDSTIPLRNHMAAHEMSKERHDKMSQVHLFSFKTIEMATNKFSAEHKLGQGGFGPVYKGKLVDGQEIAVKRLSRSSSQGVLEFENEIQLIVKLQHNNLVRLLGCCIHREEMMLVYEYMPNKSLDCFLFDPTKRESLKWTNRISIIEGIAQGLLYLHKHSRLTVIHRDLKASNILLDQNMIPKISDFGMARRFAMQDSEANTNRIVGTYGYMCPEYAIKGVVSTKTDVFSFGVLILEIVSGKKNNSSHHLEQPLNLIGLAWQLWMEGSALELTDTVMDVSNKQNEVMRCIHVGLLCVQDSPADRPSMTEVIFMLQNESLQLPSPKQPAFFIQTSRREKENEEDLHRNCTNGLSISIMEASVSSIITGRSQFGHWHPCTESCWWFLCMHLYGVPRFCRN